MNNLVRVFLVKSSAGYAIIPCDAEPDKFSGNTVMLTFDIAEKDKSLLENFAVQRIVDRIATGVEKSFYRKPEQVVRNDIAYESFVGKGRKYFRKIFSNRNDNGQQLLLRKIIEEGWNSGKNTIDIAADFRMNYKTLNGILVEWGIRSNSEFYSEKKPYRRKTYRNK